MKVTIDGRYGVLPEEDLPPPVDFSEAEDPIWEELAMVVQSADSKRGIDIHAFWFNEGYEICVIVTALSRPQLQAIAAEIEYNLRKKLRRRMVNKQRAGMKFTGAIRDQAATGWVLLKYRRISVNIMTPVQRSYYNIEGLWRDENEDYVEIPLEDILRESGFGMMRLRQKELADGAAETEARVDAAAGEEPPMDDQELDYDEDEDDPFWS